MKNNARFAIGMTVSMMRGRLSNGVFGDYFDLKQILDDWKIHKRYWSTKKDYEFCQKMTMFGETRSKIIDDWLTCGFAIEKKFEKLVQSIKPQARH